MRLRQAYADTGSLAAYREEQPRGRNQEGFYDMSKRYLVTEPYKGWSVLGFLGGLAAGTVFGPLGAIFSGLVGAGILGGYATAYHWAWGRGKRKPENPKWLDGRSIGKYVADNWERWFPRTRQAQPATLSHQYA